VSKVMGLFRSQLFRICGYAALAKLKIYSIGPIMDFPQDIGDKRNPMELRPGARWFCKRVVCRICASGETSISAATDVREVLVWS